MKKLYLLLFCLISTYSFGQIIITEIADPNNNASARYVEIYNPTASNVDLTGWSLKRWTNANTTTSSNVIDLTSLGTLTAGSFAVIASNGTAYTTAYGKTADINAGTGGPADSNGDDNIAIFDAGSTIIDMFGVAGEDGSNTCHEFEDGRAERKPGSSSKAVWDTADWNVWSDASTASGCTSHMSNTPQDAPGAFDPGAWIGTSTASTITVGGPVSGLDYFVGGGPSAEQTFTVEGSNLTADITVTAPANFEVSTTSGSGFGASVTLTQSTGSVATTTVYTRLVAGLTANSYSGDVTATSTGATSRTVALSGTVTPADPLITLTGTAITSLDYTEGSGPSAEATFTAEALFLTTDLTVTVPTNFEVSTTTGSGFAASVTLTHTSGTVATTTVYVRLKAGLSGNAHFSGNITASATGATDKTLAVSGTVYSTTLTNALVITGIFDAQVGSSPKGIELFVLSDIPDLSYFGVGSANNGGGTDGQEFTFPAVAATAGQYIYIIGTGQSASFATFFGFATDYESGAMFINGDDAMELFENTQVIDLFGDINVDGTGTAWEYLDGWAYRNSNTGPSSTFTIANWQFSGTLELDGAVNSGSSTPFIPKTYTNVLAISKQQLLDGFALYPNPVQDGFMNIQSRSNASKNISIYDVIGKRVYQKNTTATKINISHLKAGLYFVKVQQDGKMATRKLVVE
ncbi:MAG: T9SS type A sorting domain-containing protein [Flavobacteriaceae bacterium]|nr:T9SS type A sorting domain-containing protein [Flavobacteriaceae bacterium]